MADDAVPAYRCVELRLPPEMATALEALDVLSIEDFILEATEERIARMQAESSFAMGLKALAGQTDQGDFESWVTRQGEGLRKSA